MLAGSRCCWPCSDRLRPGSTDSTGRRSPTLPAILWLLVVLWHWFGDAIAESEGGMYSKRVDTSYRWSMSWFIFSEVMFFARVFRRAVLCARDHDAGLGSLDYKLIWPDFAAVWPNNGPAALVSNTSRRWRPLPMPTINTALLLTRA